MIKQKNKLTDANKILTEVNTLRKSLLNLKFQKATGQLEKTSELKKVKKRIAMQLTKLKQNRNLENA